MHCAVERLLLVTAQWLSSTFIWAESTTSSVSSSSALSGLKSDHCSRTLPWGSLRWISVNTYTLIQYKNSELLVGTLGALNLECSSTTAPNAVLLWTLPLCFSTLRSNLWTARPSRPVHLALDAPILECSSAIVPNAAPLRTLPLRFTTLRPNLASRCHHSERCSGPNAATALYHTQCNAVTAPNAAPLRTLQARSRRLRTHARRQYFTRHLCHPESKSRFPLPRRFRTLLRSERYHCALPPWM